MLCQPSRGLTASVVRGCSFARSVPACHSMRRVFRFAFLMVPALLLPRQYGTLSLALPRGSSTLFLGLEACNVVSSAQGGASVIWLCSELSRSWNKPHSFCLFSPQVHVYDITILKDIERVWLWGNA